MELPPSAKLFQYGTAYWSSQAVFAAAELGVADAVAVIGGAATAEEIGARVRADVPSLYRLLRALAGLGLLVEDAERRFTLTEMGALLKTGALRDFVRMQGEHAVPWGRLTEAVQTGKVGFELEYGQPVFDWLAEHPESAARFDGAMAGNTAQMTVVATSYDFARFSTVADLGGGLGVLLAAILEAHGGVRGLLLDLPHVLERARPYLDGRGLGGRVSLQPTDFFREVPAGADLYLMKYILHDWTDEQSVAILKNLRKVCDRLVLVEWVLPDPGQPLEARPLLADLNMLIMTGGRERTRTEWAALLERGGFRLEQAVPLPIGPSLLEAVGTARL